MPGSPPPSQLPPQPGLAAYGAPRPPNKSRRGLWTALIAAAVIIVAAAVTVPLLLLRDGPDTTTGGATTTSGVTTAGGIATTTSTTVGPPADAVARVGDTYITRVQLDQRAADFQTQYGVADEATDPEGWEQFEAEVLDFLVSYELALLEARSRGLSVTDEEIENEIDTVVTDYYGGDRAAFDQELATMNMTLDQLERDYRESMLLQKVYDEIVNDPSAVPEDEVAAYYEDHKADYQTDETRTVRHILIAPGGEATGDTVAVELTDADWAEALATAGKVRADLEAGADWSTEASLYSDDSGTKDLGGDLGTVFRGDMEQEFEDAVFSMPLDELSQPVKTVYGYHIIQVTGISEGEHTPLDEVRGEIVWAIWIEHKKAELVVVYEEGTGSSTATDGGVTTTTTAPERRLVLYDTQCRTPAGLDMETCDALPYFEELVVAYEATTPLEFAAQLPSDVKLTIERVADGMYWYWYEFDDGSKIYARFGEKY